jgi:hypothetical protein
MFDLISFLKLGISGILFSTFLFYYATWSRWPFGNIYTYKSNYLDFLENDKKENIVDTILEPKQEFVTKPEPIFEHKYLEKYNKFPTQYQFSDDDLVLEQELVLKITNENKQEITELANEIQTKLDTIQNIIFGSNTCDELGNMRLRQYFGLDDSDGSDEDYDESILDGSDEDDDESILDKNKLTDHHELFINILAEQTKYQEELAKTISKVLTADEIQLKAREALIEHKLDLLINSYVLEHTPLGNVYMRFNNTKKSFEYFSNNTIPYRFLETIGRKYVTTYWCKSVFVNIEEELEKAKLKYEEESKQQNNSKPFMNTNTKQNGFKPFNKDIRMAKNREQSNFVLPPNIQPNLVDVKTNNDSHLLKENANRYTWEGRISCFSPLKQIDKKLVNKSLNLSFSEFKQMNKANNK